MKFTNKRNKIEEASTMKKIVNYLFILVFLVGTIPAYAFANSEGTQRSLFSDFHSQEILKLTITTDIDGLLANRNSDTYQDATVVWESTNGNSITLDAGIRTRGKYRNRVCDFPPIKLKFSKKELNALGYSSYNKMKLVTHCLDEEGEGNQNVVKEYLAYQLYNELTDQSFRVQLVEVEYVDAQYPENSIVRYGIIIEHKKEMAARLNGTLVEDLYNPSPNLIDAEAENRMALFQYLIGNVDYSVSMYRNIKWVKHHVTGKLIPIPYDFDFTGLVNPSYVKVPGNLMIKSVRERIYLGLPVSDDLLMENIEFFKNKKKALLQVVRENTYLNLSNRLEASAYIRSFYSQLESLIADAETPLFEVLKNAHLAPEEEGFYGHPLG